jgi:hypothetical protein
MLKQRIKKGGKTRNASWILEEYAGIIDGFRQRSERTSSRKYSLKMIV